MPFHNELSSSPPPALEGERSIAYYKSQYEQLEAELADFQASSRELEAELEKDVEASEKRERQLQEKLEGLGYEVEEWKVITDPASALYGLAESLCLLTDRSALDQIQAVQSRGQFRPEYAAKGDNNLT